MNKLIKVLGLVFLMTLSGCNKGNTKYQKYENVGYGFMVETYKWYVVCMVGENKLEWNIAYNNLVLEYAKPHIIGISNEFYVYNNLESSAHYYLKVYL